MQRPGWSTVVAILMMLVGGCGTINDLKQIKIEEVMVLQDDILDEITEETNLTESISEEGLQKLIEFSGDSLSLEIDSLTKGEAFKASIKKMSYMPAETIHRLKVAGYLGLPISIAFIVTGILFFYRRKYVVPIAIVVLMISLLYTSYQLLELNQLEVSNLLKVGLNLNLSFGLFLDFILLIIIFMSDKSYYKPTTDFSDYFDEQDTREA